MQDKDFEGQVMLPSKPLTAQKGRGAVTNLQGRYEVNEREEFDDGWEHEEEAPRVWRTHVTEEMARTILSRNQSPDIPFGVSLNPYRGCEHGCIYCFARPTHSYLGLSPGLDFESKLYAKVNAPQLLRSELAKAGYEPSPIALGVNTDAYQPCERDYKLTRRVLEVLQECDHPVGLITKSSLIERDIDILAPMAARNLAAAPHNPHHRGQAHARPRVAPLTDAGIPVSVSVAPIIPFVTEPDIEKVIEAAFEAGAINVSYVVLRLPWEVAPLFKDWLEAHFPDRAARVMNRVRDMRGGKDYDATFGKRMHGEGVWADLIRQRVEKAVQRRATMSRGMRFKYLDCTAFKRPAVVPARVTKLQATSGQMDLF
jgi:DNA repair photolyase